jgi:hypothetical protein
MKNSNDTIGNGTRDFPVCSVVPQTTNETAVHTDNIHATETDYGLATKWKYCA